MRAVVIAVFALMLIAGPVWADNDPSDVYLWSQDPEVASPMAYASQQAYEYPFFAESVNDFEPYQAGEINHVHWWGMYWGKKGRGLELSIQRVDWSGQPAGRASIDCTGSQRVTCGADGLERTTVGAASNVDQYGGCPWSETGPEIVYQLKIPFGGTNATFSLTDMTEDLDLFLLSHCDENMCITYADQVLSYTFPEPGTYYLVVDGYEGAAGPFALSIECPGVPPVIFCVRFYENVPGTRNGPGEMLYEHWTDDYHEVSEGSGLYSYWADIPPFPVDAGTRYWVSFQIVSNRTDTGQWGSAKSVQFELANPYMDFDLLGVPRWTSFADPILNYPDADLAFELVMDPTPVEKTSWTTIKAMYR